MIRSLVSGLTGIRAHQTSLDVIGNNIANINTPAFKAGRAAFSEALALTVRGGTPPTDTRNGMNPFQIGRGSVVNSIDTIFSQGGLETTGNPTDLTISGQGFFVLRFGDNTLYTRDGSFALDANGTFVDPNTGGAVQGRMANEKGEILSSTPVTDIVLPIGSLFPARATSNASITGNLDSTAELGNIPFVGDAANATFIGNLNGIVTTSSTNNSFSKDIIIYDYMGIARPVKITFTKSVDPDPVADPPVLAEWTWEASDISGAVSGDGTVKFNSDGTYNSSTVANALTCQNWGTGGTNNIIVNVDFSGMTQTNGPYSPMLLSPVPDGSYQTTLMVYDSLGGTHDVIINFQKLTDSTIPPPGSPIIDNSWKMTIGVAGNDEAYIPDAAGQPLYEQIMEFNTDGSIKTGATATIIIEGKNGSSDGTTSLTSLKNGANSIRISLDLSNLVQFAGAFTPVPSFRDGHSAGSLDNITIDDTGTLIGTFTNGASQKLAQVVLADFHNPSGLIRVGDNLYSVSMNSGAAVLGTAGAGIRASIISNSLESSNVDLANEFTKMIIAQRGFEANSRVITTSDTILGELINLRR
ncbi:MAG: flagellar hook protein FlgE [bacterium]